MKTVASWMVLAGAAAATAACHPAKLGHGRNPDDHPTALALPLHCPERQGELRRTSQAADGRSCAYRSDAGATVTLAATSLDGRSPEQALSPLEEEAHRLVPAATASPGKAHADAHADADDGGDEADDADAAAGSGPPAPPSPPAPPAPPAHGRTHEEVHLRLPGLRIDTGDDGKAHVEGWGHTVVADEGGATVTGAWNGAQTSIKAHEGGVEMRFGAVGRQAVDMTYLVSGETPGPSGDRVAGYVARGPVGGPLLVAEVHGPAYARHVGVARDDPFRDAKRLVERNLRRPGG